MIEEMKTECVELSITACEKFAANYEVENFLEDSTRGKNFIKSTVFFIADGRKVN